MATRAVPQPVFLFRPAHQQLSSNTPPRTTNHLHFIHHNQHRALLSTDCHGWISIWNLNSKRIQSLWLAHPNTENIGGCLWATSLVDHQVGSHLFILSQGRDHRLILSQILNYLNICTIETITRANLKPSTNNPSTNVIQLAEASINAINFCKASSLTLPTQSTTPANPNQIHSIVALPSLITEELLDVFAVQIVQPPKIFRIYKGLGRDMQNGTNNNQTGSIVAVQLFSPPGASGLILLMIGFESGHVRLLKNDRLIGNDSVASGSGCGDDNERCMETSDWESVGEFKGHTEPILSLAISIDPLDPRGAIGWSVGADRNIVRYHVSSSLPQSQTTPPTESSSSDSSIDGSYQTAMEAMIFETNQCGRFDVQVRSDGKVVGIYNWGGKVWLFDSRPIVEVGASAEGPDSVRRMGRFTLRPLAVLKLATEPDRRSGVLAFAPFPPPASSSPDIPLTSAHHLPHRLDSLVGLALLVASGTAGQLSAWEVFPPKHS